MKIGGFLGGTTGPCDLVAPEGRRGLLIRGQLTRLTLVFLVVSTP